jgi:hypothetical protein
VTVTPTAVGVVLVRLIDVVVVTDRIERNRICGGCGGNSGLRRRVEVVVAGEVAVVGSVMRMALLRMRMTAMRMRTTHRGVVKIVAVAKMDMIPVWVVMMSIVAGAGAGVDHRLPERTARPIVLQ